MVRKYEDPYGKAFDGGYEVGKLNGITYEQLKKALGKNDGPLNHGENVQWWLEMDDGTPVTIYDYHPSEYRSRNDITDWWVKSQRAPSPNLLHEVAFEISAQLADVS